MKLEVSFTKEEKRQYLMDNGYTIKSYDFREDFNKESLSRSIEIAYKDFPKGISCLLADDADYYYSIDSVFKNLVSQNLKYLILGL